ncbi:MAG: hypothetical protein AB4040_04555 [Synechococcus sp.]
MSNVQDFQELLTRARRIAFGTAASLIEILQDSSKREENIQKISDEFNQLANELAVKGEETEMEARRYVDTWLGTRREGQADSQASQAPTKIEVVDITEETRKQEEVEELTAEVQSLRAELEKLRGSTENGSSADNS